MRGDVQLHPAEFAVAQAQAGNKMRPLRRELARVKTILREKGVKD